MDAKNSIRVAMRNILAKSAPQGNDEKSGKWTMIPIENKPVAPPAPTISQHTAREMKKDEQIIGQWSTVEPIISAKEKQLLENLKGRLKTQNKNEETSKNNSSPKKEERDKVREKSRDRGRADRNYRGRKSRSKSRTRSRSNSRRRSNSRNRSRSRGRYNRRYSRSRSNSKGRYRRHEKPYVSFPSEPRLPPLRDEKKQPARSYVTTKKDESSSSSTSLKKMPFIGKMPVFKKQLSEKKIESSQDDKKNEDKAIEVPLNIQRNRDEAWDDLMPDPMQFSAIMGDSVPPPPPIINNNNNNNNEPDAPPGLDPDIDFEFIPKPISDAPILRKGINFL
jgi:hypothetical protein